MTTPRKRAMSDSNAVPEMPIAARALQVAQDALTQIEHHERDCLRRQDSLDKRWEALEKRLGDGFDRLTQMLAKESQDSSEKRAIMHRKVEGLRNWIVGLVISGLVTTLLLTIGIVGFFINKYVLH